MIRILGGKEKVGKSRIKELYLKKCGGELFRERPREYEFIREHMNTFPVENMCHGIKVGSSGFYKWVDLTTKYEGEKNSGTFSFDTTGL